MTDITHRSSSIVPRSGPLKRRKSETPDGFVLLTEDEPFEQEKKENNNLTEYRDAPSSPSASDATNDLSPFENLGSPGSPPPFNPIDNERLPNELLDEICSDVGFKDTMDLDIVEFLMDQEVPTTDAGQICDPFPAGLFSVNGCMATPTKGIGKSGDRASSPGLPPTGYSACSSTSGSPVSKRFHAAPLSSQSSPQKDSSSANTFKLPKTPSKTCSSSDANTTGFQSPSRHQTSIDNSLISTPSKTGNHAGLSQDSTNHHQQQSGQQQQQQHPQVPSDGHLQTGQHGHHHIHPSHGTASAATRCCSPSSGAPPPLHHLGPRHPVHQGQNLQNPQASMVRPSPQRMPQGYPQSPGFKKMARPSPPVVNVLNMPQSQNMPQTQNSRWINNNNCQGSMQQHPYHDMNQNKYDQGKLGFYNNPNAASQYMSQQGRTLDSPLDQGYFSGDTASVRSFSSSSSSTGTTVMCGGVTAGKGHMMRRAMGSNPALNQYMPQAQHPQEMNIYRAAQGGMAPNGGIRPSGGFSQQQQHQFGNECDYFGKTEPNDQAYPGQMGPMCHPQGNPQVNRPYPSPGVTNTNCFDNSFNPVGNFETDFNDNEQKSISTKILPRCSPYVKSDVAPYTVPCNNGQTVANPYDIRNTPGVQNGGIPQQAGGHNMEIAPNTSNYDNCRPVPDIQNPNMSMMPSMEGSNMHIPQSMPSPGRGYGMNSNNSSSMQMPPQTPGACDSSMHYGNRSMQQGSAMDPSFVGQMSSNMQMPATPQASSCSGGMGVQQPNMTSTPHPGHHMSTVCSGGGSQYPVSNNPMGGVGNQSWQQGNSMAPQQMGQGYGKPQGMCAQGMSQPMGQGPVPNGAPPPGHMCGPNCNCKNAGRRPPVISSQQSFIQHLITDRSNAFRSHPLFPLLRDLIIADMNFNSPSFPYQLIRNLPADFDKLLQNFLQRNPPNGSYQNNYAVESVIMDALKYAHQCLIEKIKVRQEQDKHTKTTSKSLSAIEEFCEKFDRAVRNSMSKPEHPAAGNHGDMGVVNPMMNGGQGSGVVPLPGGAAGMSAQDHKHSMEMPPPSGYLSSPMKKMDHMGGMMSHFHVLRDLPDSASESGSSISSTSCHNKTESKKHPSLPKEAVAMMLDWLRNHKDNPYPNDDEKAMLIKQTGLTINQINYWFTNARRRILPKWAQAKT